MGECGCGNFSAQYQLPGPDGTVYAIQKYEACDYCDTPHGVVVHRFSPEGAKTWGADELPLLPFHQMHGRDFDGQTAAIPVVHPGALWKELARHSTGDEDERVVDEDGLREALAAAVFEAK